MYRTKLGLVCFIATHARIVFMVVPIYIAEISPKQKRGRLVSVNFLAMPVGFLVCPVASQVPQFTLSHHLTMLLPLVGRGRHERCVAECDWWMEDCPRAHVCVWRGTCMWNALPARNTKVCRNVEI